MNQDYKTEFLRFFLRQSLFLTINVIFSVFMFRFGKSW